MTLQSLLLSIRSLMHENPYFNEPGYEGQSKSAQGLKASEDYNKHVRFNTLKVAIRDMLMSSTGDNRHMPETLHGVMKRYFSQNYSRYEVAFERSVKAAGLLDKTTIGRYRAIVKELQGYKKEHQFDDEITWVMYRSICEKFAPSPPKVSELSSSVDVDQFNDYLADSHAEDSDNDF